MTKFFNRANVRTVIFLKNVVSVKEGAMAPGRAPRGVGEISVDLQAPYIPPTPASPQHKNVCVL